MLLKIKEKYKPIIIIVLASILLSLLCFGSNLNIIDDTPYHLRRIYDLSESIKNGVFIPYMYSDLANTYGYPNPIFYPQLFLYIPALLMCLGLSLGKSYLTFLFIINMVTGLSMYICLKKMKFSQSISLIASLLYLIAPYRLIDIFFRNALGEVLFFPIFPIVILGIYKILDDSKNYYILAFSMTAMLYSHLISFFITVIIVFIIVLFNFKKLNKNKIINLVKATVLSILLSIAFLLPMIEQMIDNKYLVNIYDWFGGIGDNTIEFLSINNQITLLILNIVLLLVLILLCYRVKRKNDRNFLIAIFFSITIYSFILATNMFPWYLITDIIPFFNKIQFAWRFLMIPTYSGAILLALIIDKVINSDIGYKFIISILLCTSLLIGIIFNDFNSVSDSSSPLDIKISNLIIGNGEYIPAQFKGFYPKKLFLEDTALNTINVLEGNDIIKSFDIKNMFNGKMIEYKLTNSNSNIELPLFYYKGYTTYINNKEVTTNRSENGLILINNKDCLEGTIKVYYEGTIIQKISFLITLLTVVFLLIKSRILSNKLKGK